MLTAVLIKEKNKLSYQTECGLIRTITEEEAERLRIKDGIICCPLFKGRDCSNIRLSAVKNEITRDRFIQLRSPSCVEEKDIQIYWKNYEIYLKGLQAREIKRERNLAEEIGKDDD